MIILSGVLVIVAIALLVAGIVAGNGESAQVLGLDALVVIYISIGVSVVSALCLAIGVFLRRKELFGTGAAVAPARKSARKGKDQAKGKGGKPAAAPVPAAGRGKPAAPVGPTAGPADDDTEIPPPPADVPDDAVVFVVRGRKRYHLDTCRQLAGRDKEELTYAEAREEGFSSCTACMPDTALAARAAVSVPAGVPAGGKTAGGGPAEGTAGKGEPGKSGPVGLGKSAPAAGATTPLPAEALRSESAEGRTAENARSEPAASGSATAGPAMGGAAAVTTEIPVSEPPSATPAPGAGDPAPDRADEAAGSVPAPAPAAEPDSPPSGPVPSAWPAPGGAADAPAAPGEPAPAASEDAPPSEPAGEGDEATVRILSGTKRYHRADCSLIEDIGDEAEDLETISRAEARTRGCTPCLVCRPDDA
ncbi:hypothetical protein [Actinomadura sp. 21ATH]|uniref:hypothetical protein n=1 Tax=Actinomadura sp. 21ATH TaxID=1735444 RepID=UPI0035BFB36C